MSEARFESLRAVCASQSFLKTDGQNRQQSSVLKYTVLDGGFLRRTWSSLKLASRYWKQFTHLKLLFTRGVRSKVVFEATLVSESCPPLDSSLARSEFGRPEDKKAYGTAKHNRVKTLKSFKDRHARLSSQPRSQGGQSRDTRCGRSPMMILSRFAESSDQAL